MMVLTEIKLCIYCGVAFTRVDFPQTFNRMVTCGNIGCMKKRRIELWKRKHK